MLFVVCQALLRSRRSAVSIPLGTLVAISQPFVLLTVQLSSLNSLERTQEVLLIQKYFVCPQRKTVWRHWCGQRWRTSFALLYSLSRKEPTLICEIIPAVGQPWCTLSIASKRKIEEKCKNNFLHDTDWSLMQIWYKASELRYFVWSKELHSDHAEIFINLGRAIFINTMHLPWRVKCTEARW